MRKAATTYYIGDYIRQERLGRGSFASVYKGIHKVTHESVAIKDIYVEKMPEKNLEAEISIMREIKHPNIVRLIDCIRTKGHVYLVMEYCSLGDLNTFLKNTCENKGMKEADLIHFLGQMGSALKYLRQRNFVHRDIKPQNILLVPSNDGSALPTIKISDFGFARFLPNASLTTSYCGTPLYMAPEVISRKSYDAKADLWSVGVLLYEMMMGRKICQTNQMFELEEFLRNYKNKVDFTGSEYTFSTELKDLISVLLKKNPAERASCEDFFHHVELLMTSKDNNDDDEEYVVVIDMKRTASANTLDFNQLSLNGKYSSSAPTGGRRSFDPSYYSEDYMIRERKFSVGSAGSVLTKAISKAFFGASSSGSSNYSSHSSTSPPSPTTPPIIEEEENLVTSQTLVVEEMTLDKLLISSTKINHTDNTPSLIPTPEYTAFIQKLDHFMKMIEAVESFAQTKLKQSNASPFDFEIAEETMVIYLKVALLMQMAMVQIKGFKPTTKKCTRLYESLQVRYKNTMDQAYRVSEQCGREQGDIHSDLSIESILYNHAVESSCKADILEVTNEDLKGSMELFRYSILLLEAVLQVKDKSHISTEDRHIVKRLIRSIHGRLDVVINKTNKQ